ncbi:MAG: hypothetical protein K2P57_00370 [Burkholderiales bacterium]|nr:hypothetical protein [Burkholderiales bacterium]
MNRTMTCLILMLTSRMALAACTVPQEFWDWPRSGGSVLAAQDMRPCIDALLAEPKSKLVIHHGKDSESALHFDELRAWLISLAVSPSRILDADDLPAKGLSLETLNL